MPWPFLKKDVTDNSVTTAQNFSSSTRFAFKLFHHLFAGHETSNVFFSPFSVRTCLLMLWEGATGQTRQTISNVLEIDSQGSGERSAEVFRRTLGITGPGLEFVIANSLWCDDQFRLQPSFLTQVQNNYGAEVFPLPLANRDAAASINRWVAEKTRKRINKILDDWAALTAVVALNAIYFKETWEQSFSKSLTRNEVFHAAGRNEIRVPLMFEQGTYRYLENSSVQAIRLPYKGRRVGMYVFLPSLGSRLDHFLHDATAGLWEHWISLLRETKGTIALPRFRFEHGVDLSPILRDLGMAVAFTPNNAQFDGIASPPPPLWLDKVIHRALVEVNEEGTEAAAVTFTAVLGSAMVRKPERTFTMIVNRPFFFAICDDQPIPFYSWVRSTNPTRFAMVA